MNRALSIGEQINNETNSEQYTITGVIGRGASTIAYTTMHTDGCYSSTRILKEYCPSYIELKRDNSGALQYDECDKERYENGLVRFLEGGKRQNALRECANLRNQTSPIIKQVKANNTVYLDVTPFEGKIFENIQDFSLLERLEICLAIAKLVRLYHQEGYLCLDIKPSNIFVLKGVTQIVQFIDFDSVKEKSEISFGNSLSYTKNWAAPEQENPYSVENISEGTDVYAVGEIIFWALFNRHSTVKEHRGNSRYPFYESVFAEIQKKTVQDLLIKLFRNTIRSSVKNRFGDMEPVIDILQNILEILSRKEKINPYEICTKDFFVGRHEELKVIEDKLLEHKILFVSGIPGIGKSEVVKQYIKLHAEKYSNVLYWFYDGDFEKMICNDHSVSISNFKQEKNEPDIEYGRRKLDKLTELVDENTLIFIDNLDVVVEEINSPELWNKLKSLPGKLIVTTRGKQRNYELIEISEIKDKDILKEIFYKHCPDASEKESERECVYKIIELANYHTYEVELLASHANAEKKFPSELLEDMKKYGIGDFDKTEISIAKDGIDRNATFVRHLQKIFSLNNLSVEQKRLLLKMAFIPNGGVDIHQFKLFYSITDFNDLNWLIRHGFVYETGIHNRILSIHPAVAEMVVNIIKVESESIDSYYEDAIQAMRKGYDDESVNEYLLNKQILEIKRLMKSKWAIREYKRNKLSREEIENRYHEVVEKFENEYAKSEIKRDIYIMLCNAIAYNSLRYQMQKELSARFLTQYVQWFMKFGQYNFQIEVMQFVKNIYDSISLNEYFPDREYMYDIYSLLLLKRKENAEEVLNISMEHLHKAVKVRDWLMAFKWCTNIANAYEYLENPEEGTIYRVKSFVYTMKRKKKYVNSFDNDEYSSISRSVAMYEIEYEKYIENPYAAIMILRMAIWARKKVGKTKGLSANNITIHVDEAKIKMIQQDIRGAKEEILPIFEAYQRKEVAITEALYDAIEFLGKVSTDTGEYENALIYYKECLNIIERIDCQEKTYLKEKIERVYYLWYKGRLSEKNMQELVDEFEEKNINISKIFQADEYYNKAVAYWNENKIDDAISSVREARKLFQEDEAWCIHCKRGKGNCIILEAQIIVSQYRSKEHK